MIIRIWGNTSYLIKVDWRLLRLVTINVRNKITPPSQITDNQVVNPKCVVFSIIEM